MNMKEFTNRVIESANECFGDVKVSCQSFSKNNGIILTGLTFKDSMNIAPTIYLEPFFEQFKAGRALEEIVMEIKQIYLSNRAKQNIDISFFTDYEKVKDNIIFNIVNYEKNEELLKQIPHVKFLDLAIIFRCVVSCSSQDHATILIYNHHMTFWGVETEELYELAKSNTPRLYNYHFENLVNVLFDMCDVELDFEEIFPMYVLTNKQKMWGACCMLYDDLISKIAEQLQADLYIIPSSIQEVILIPANIEKSVSKLNEIVTEVNSTQVSDEEVLSNHVYFFSRETGKITM